MADHAAEVIRFGIFRVGLARLRQVLFRLFEVPLLDGELGGEQPQRHVVGVDPQGVVHRLPALVEIAILVLFFCQVVQHRGENHSLKREGEARAEEPLEAASQKAVRAGRAQNVETEHGGRQYERERHDGFDEESPAAAGTGQPRGQRQPDDKQDRSGASRHGERETKGNPVQNQSPAGSKPNRLKIAFPSALTRKSQNAPARAASWAHRKTTPP